MSCGAIPSTSGAALRISQYMDCGAERLGRDGFLGFAQYAFESGIVGAALTIFVALFGLSLMLGKRFDLASLPITFGKIGLVFALLFSWPVFQTLIYEVVVDGPEELTNAVTAGTGFDVRDTPKDVQRGYEALRTGTALGAEPGTVTPPTPVEAEQQGFQVQTPMPLAATLFVASTIGAEGATKLAAAFLLSIAPIPIVALLFFSPGLGLFVTWLRALLTMLIATAGVRLVAAMHVGAIESEFEQLLIAGQSTVAWSIDRQSFLTVTTAFALATLAIIIVSASMTRGITRFVPWRGADTLRESVDLWSDRARATTHREDVGPRAEIPRLSSTGLDRVELVTQSLERREFREHKAETSVQSGTASPTAVRTNSRLPETSRISTVPPRHGRGRSADPRTTIRGLNG